LKSVLGTKNEEQSTKNDLSRTSFLWVTDSGHLRRMVADLVAVAGQNGVWRRVGLRDVLYCAPDYGLRKRKS
jgi:hypothetical protein